MTVTGSGVVGRALTARLFALGWVERNGIARGVRVSDDGRRHLRGRSVQASPSTDLRAG